MNNEKPIFIQIMEMIEDSILLGEYQVDDLIISTPQISSLLSVNPTTAQKAVTILTDHGILYKKRGIGMAVTKEAREKILLERRKVFLEEIVPKFISGAQKIGISNENLIQIIEEVLKND